MAGFRKNSIVIDFSVMPVRPKLNVVQEFLFKQMSLDMSLVKNLQTSITKSHVIIELDSAATAENVVMLHNMKHTLEHDKQLYHIPVHPTDNAIEVKVYDLPPHMPNNLISAQFSAYGKVLSVKNDVWKDYFPGIPNGVRIIRMEIQTPIPSYVPVAGELSYVLYSNQVKTCRHCTQKVHIGKTCSAARKESSQNAGEKSTLAEIVSNSQASTNESPIELMEATDSESDDESVASKEATTTQLSTADSLATTMKKTSKSPETPNFSQPVASTSNSSKIVTSETETDPLGGRKRTLSPKQAEQESQRPQRRTKSQRHTSK